MFQIISSYRISPLSLFSQGSGAAPIFRQPSARTVVTASFVLHRCLLTLFPHKQHPVCTEQMRAVRRVARVPSGGTSSRPRGFNMRWSVMLFGLGLGLFLAQIPPSGSELQINDLDVKKWAENFGANLYRLSTYFSGADLLRTEYRMNNNWKIVKMNGSEMVQKFARDMFINLGSKRTAVEVYHALPAKWVTGKDNMCSLLWRAADISVARVLFTKRHGAEEPECHPQILKNSNRLNMLLGLLDLPAAKTTRSDAGPSGT
ncbi:Voltage-dependent calcium channel subunit alpha-2/delta-4 [Branchiostoma belcheri]|nr:Voltage-dependent calcium channel subunit alpha-2/delta-4 [Branchiostoma belcheri]